MRRKSRCRSSSNAVSTRPSKSGATTRAGAARARSSRSATGRSLFAVTEDASELRVSDEERDAAAREIRDHFASGPLTDDELSERLSAIHKARTERELRALRT